MSLSIYDATIHNLLPTAELPTALCFPTTERERERDASAYINTGRWDDGSSAATSGGSSDRQRDGRDGIEFDLTAGITKERSTLRESD